jgi:hypothetical protein
MKPELILRRVSKVAESAYHLVCLSVLSVCLVCLSVLSVLSVCLSCLSVLSVCPSVRLPAYIGVLPTGLVSLKSGFADFYKNLLGKSKFD